MMCVICISRGGSASVSFSEVEERAVDLRKVSTVLSQSEPTRYVGLFEWVQKCRNLNAFRFVSAPIRMNQPPEVKSLSVLKIDGRKPTSWAQFATCSHQEVISCLL